MKMCKYHWNVMREAVEERGMMGLVNKSGEAAMEGELKQLDEAKATGEVSEQTLRDTFDPLMSMHWHWSNSALRNGGLYIMAVDEAVNPDNEGHYCPVCEFVKHIDDFDAKEQIGIVADQMRAYCVEQKLIPSAS